jgi:PAS domain S-box-containing protein
MPGSDNLGVSPIYLSVFINTEFKIIHCNHLLYEILALDQGSLTGKPLKNLHNCINIAKCKKAAETCLKRPDSIIKINVETIIKKTKEEKAFQWEISALTNSRKKVIGICMLGADITKDLRIEQQYRSLSENVPGAVYEYVFKKSGTYGFKYLSPTIQKMFGISKETFVQSFNHVHPEDRERLADAINHSAKTNETFYFEGRLIAPDGTIKWHSASSSFSYLTKEGDRIFTGIILDITDRKKVEEDILRNESRFRLMLSKLGDNTWEHNFQKNETIFSETIYNLLGRTASDLTSNIDLWWQSIPPEDRWMVEENDKKYKAGQLESHSLEYRVFHADGSMKWVLDRGVVIEKTETGFPIRIIGSHKDITKEKELQKHLLYQEQQKKKEILQAVLEAQERERQEIAYELNENINQILSMCKLMLNAEVSDKNGKSLEKVVGHIDQVIDEVRNISYNLSTSSLQLIGLPEAVAGLISKINIAGKLIIKLDTRKYKFKEGVDPKISLTVFRIIQEQMTNIVKHANATVVEIHLGSTQNKISVTVKDNGKGFDKATVKMGLGLANITSRVENYNGTIYLETQPGMGCNLKATIPLIK